MNVAKASRKMTKKGRETRALSDIPEHNQSIISPQRVFLYLHPKSITYSLDGIPSTRSEIEVEHQYMTITSLSEHYMPRNIIRMDQFDIVKPTFSVTIEQDSLENITILSDCPILLTLYVYTKRKTRMNETTRKKTTEEELFEDIRIPVAQGHIDIIECFCNKRTNRVDTVFLYPLRSDGLFCTCKTEWEIYSLHPLLRTIIFSNFVYISLYSLYGINEELMDGCQNLVAKLSFISKMPNEENNFDKIFICNFKTFTKSIISQQNLAMSWETLKNYESGNINCMGIAPECKINPNQLFSNLLTTNNAKFNFIGINVTEHFALVCNSMHRYVLTDEMQNILEDVLSRNVYDLILEFYSEGDESKILLQGYIDLSIFMYPNVNYCPFAIELRAPENKLPNPTATKDNLKSRNYNVKHGNTQLQQIKEDDVQFAIIQIRLDTSITCTCRNLKEISSQPKSNNYCQYMATEANSLKIDLVSRCEQVYRAFDDLIHEIIDYCFVNNIKKLIDDKEFFCDQLSNINNKIMKLVASDFNIKTPTKTNIEFTNLITNVYRDLISRIYDYIKKCSISGLENCVFDKPMIYEFIVRNMSLAKYLYEIGNIEMANVIMNTLRTEYTNNTKLKFYIFLYDIEKQKFELANKYLKSSWDHKDTEYELFEDLIQIYVNYKLHLEHSELNETAEGDLIETLYDYTNSQDPTSLTAFILLYCAYKRHNYQPGMEYCRWHYENLYDSKFIKLEVIPKSRWEIYMPHDISLKSIKGQHFIEVCRNLLHLGLYSFAQWIFDEIADECTEIERYFFSSTFMILDNKDNLSTKNFVVDNLENPAQMRATLSLVNGNLEYLRVTDRSPAFIKHYQDIAEIKEIEMYGPYQLGLLRYAHKAVKEKKYEEAGQVFLKLCTDKISSMVAAIGRGKACYHLGQLDEAEKYFAISTEHDIYMENTWAYLALINLKKGNIFNALECWKYARLNQNIEIHEDILSELEKINCSDVFLFIDIPNK